MSISSYLSLAIVFFISFSAHAGFVVDDINPSYTKITVVEQGKTSVDLKEEQKLQIVDKFGEDCRFQVIKIVDKKAVGDISACSNRKSISVGNLVTTLSKSEVIETKPVASNQPTTENLIYEPYVQNGYLNYESISFDSITDDATGVSFGGTIDLNSRFYFGAGFGKLSVSSVDITISTFSFGLQTPITPQSRLLIGISNSNANIESSTQSVSESSTGANLSWLYRPVESSQIGLGVTAADGDVSYAGYLAIIAAENLAIQIGISSSESASGFSIGIGFFD